MNLTTADKLKLKTYGISETTVQDQFHKLKEGPTDLDLRRACILEDGINRISETEVKPLIEYYNQQSKSIQISMFTPASGAATRMFKHLFSPNGNQKLYDEFVTNLSKFAFYTEVPIKEESVKEKVDYILQSKGLNYSKLPKALISFHQYGNERLKAIDEQLIEGINYLNINGVSRFHFTISPEHKDLFNHHLAQVLPVLESKFKTKIEVEFSFQEKFTDTIALNEDEEIVRDEKGEILLRPGGHGSLIHNLNQIQSDIVFIKNIDNIARQEFHNEVIKYKQLLGAQLLQTQNDLFSILNELDQDITKDRLFEIQAYVLENYKIDVSVDKDEIKSRLNKPIRVCGMVKNEGKAGGGPFWVGDKVQIVESAQMNMDLLEVQEMLHKASHFNPVDLVCGLKDYRGNRFDLLKFTDDYAFFVSEKSYLGNDIKVLEHPGLWNGAMSNWLTFFVEVPVETFNPVKTVNDLLLPQHCAENK